MKLIALLLVACACTLASPTGEDQHQGKVVQLCGAELARAVKKVCEDGDLDFFNLQHVQHHHQHHKHDHQHDHNWKGHAMKRAAISIADQCCAKPCHIKDFVTYCP